VSQSISPLSHYCVYEPPNAPIVAAVPGEVEWLA